MAVDVNLIQRQPALSFPEPTSRPEHEYHGQSQIGLEEALGIVQALANGADGDVELGNQYDNVHDEAEPASVDTAGGFEGNLVQSVPVVLPRGAESNVSEADAAPGEERGEARQGEKPVKHGRALGSKRDVGEETEEDDDADTRKRAAGAVDVGEDLGGVSLLREGCQSTRAAVDSGDADREDRNENDDIHERVETLQPGILAHENEGRGVCISIGVIAVEKVGVVVRDQETDKEQSENVESVRSKVSVWKRKLDSMFQSDSQGNSPENLFNGTWESLDRVLGFRSREADQLRTTECESGSDENTAESLKTIRKCAWLVPEASSPIFIVHAVAGSSSEYQYEGNDHEDDCRAEFDDGRDEFFFGVP